MSCQCSHCTGSLENELQGHRAELLCASCRQLADRLQVTESEHMLKLARKLLYDSDSLSDGKEAIKQAIAAGMNLGQIRDYLDWAEFHKQQLAYAKRRRFKIFRRLPKKTADIPLLNQAKS